MSFEKNFNSTKHAKYFNLCLKLIPGDHFSLDTNRLTLAFFSVGGLSLLNCVDDLDKDGIIDWIYGLQIVPNNTDSNLSRCGFRGSPSNSVGVSTCEYDESHVANTYVALGTLLNLGDDLSRVNRRGIMEGLRALQLPGGCFQAMQSGGESDMRFAYCACCVCYMLDDWRGVDTERLTRYILASQRYDGAFAQGPGLESHGGSTFCALASLHLMGRLGCLPRRSQLIAWLAARQESGLNGRPNKQEDTCYAFWVGASLKLLHCYDMVDAPVLGRFILSTEGPYGGFSKWPNHSPDPLHAYMGLSGLSLSGLLADTLPKMHPSLNIPERSLLHKN